MSTRFYAGPISNGMGRRWDDWDERCGPQTGVDTRLQRGRAALARPRGAAANEAAPSPQSRHHLVDPIAPRR